MKKLLLFILNFCFVVAMGQNLIPSIIISLPPNPPENTAGWATAMPPVMIMAQTKMQNGQIPGAVSESKILVTIKSGGNIICGTYNSQTAPQSNFNSVTRTWSGAAVLSLLGKDCILKPGTYELCVQFYALNPAQGGLLGEACKSFTIAEPKQQTYSPPQNILPTNGKVFTEQEANMPIMLRWMQVLPKPQGDVLYKVRIIEILPGQNKTEALSTNTPIDILEVKNNTQTVYKLSKSITSLYWVVEAESAERGQGDKPRKYGRSEATSFSVRQEISVDEKTAIEEYIKPLDQSDTTPQNSPCEYVKFIELVSPANELPLNLAKNKIVKFRWTNLRNWLPEAYGYKLTIYEVGQSTTKEIFSTISDNSSFDWDTRELKNIGKEPLQLQWRVAIVDKNTNQICPTQQYGMFMVASNNNDVDIVVDNLNITCKKPNSYDAQGNVNYDIVFKVIDQNSKCAGIAINPLIGTTANPLQTYKLIIGGIQYPIVFDASFPLQPIINSGTSYLAKGSFSVPSTIPVGAIADLRVYYHYNCAGDALDDWDNTTTDLPNCACNVCDNKQKSFVTGTSAFPNTVTVSGSTVGYDILTLSGGLSISGPNITEVKVELVAFDAFYNPSTGCKEMKNVSNYAQGTFVNITANTLGSSGEFQAPSYTTSIAGTGREVRWVSINATGVNMGTVKPITLQIGIPDYLETNCCKPQYNYCIRLTLRDVDCKVCTFLICKNTKNGMQGFSVNYDMYPVLYDSQFDLSK